MTRYAHSVRVFLEGKTPAPIKTIGFNGKAKDNLLSYDLLDLDDDEKSFGILSLIGITDQQGYLYLNTPF